MLKTPPELDAWEKWRHRPLTERMNHVARVLERSASLGSEDAAKSFLAHARWMKEFKNGRAPTRRGDEGNGVTITIVDDITGKRAVRVEAGKQREALPPSQEEPTSDGDR